MSDSSPASTRSSQVTGLGSVFKSLTKSFKSAAGGGGSSNSTPQINPTVLGYAHGTSLNELLGKLGPNNSSGSRIAASEMIRSAVENSSVSSIPEIWYQAREMIGSKHMVECRRAGMRLLNACICHDEHAIGPRIVYYRDIIMHSNLEEFDLQLQALKTLTNDGRDLLDLYQSGYPLTKVLCGWLRRLANETQEVRGRKKRDVALPWSTMEDNFHNLLLFIKNCLKFNITAFDEQALGAVLKEAVGICRKTAQRPDIAYCCDLIDTVMVYGYLPLENLGDILEVMCGITITVEEQADQAWRTVHNLAKSHAGNNSVMILCDILAGQKQKERNSNTMRGAALFLVRLLKLSVGESAKEIVEIPIGKVLESFHISLSVESLRHGLEVCNCMYDILTSDVRNNIPYELWESRTSSPLETIWEIGQMPLPQQRTRRELATNKSSDSDAGLEADATLDQIVGKFNQIGALVAGLIADKESFNGPIDALVVFLLDMSQFLDEKCALTVIDCFEAGQYCHPLTSSWAENLDTLITNYWTDDTLPTRVRIRVIKLVREVYLVSRDINEHEMIKKLMDKVFSHVVHEKDMIALNAMLDLLIEVAVSCDLDEFADICELFSKAFPEPITNGSPTPQILNHSGGNERTKFVARALANIFVLTFRFSPTRAKRVYFCLVTVCQKSTHTDPLAFVEAARLLARLRVAMDNHILLTTPTNMDGLASSFGRSHTTHSKTGHEAWWYPEELPYLGSEHLDIPSTMLKRSGISITEIHEIDISLWFKVIISVVENGGAWEVYSYTLAHFAPQLSNIQLFCDCIEDIKKLRTIMCEQIAGGKIPYVQFPKDISRLDPLVALIRTVSSLVGYSAAVFNKTDTDYIVQSLVLGLTAWEKTAVPCIHGLVVCCYEFPLSIKKFLVQIFAKLQTKITTTTSSPHVLEFLLALSRLPSLTDNFTLLEYKQVFGMAFKYIQHASDLAKQPAKEDDATLYMSQYLLALAYNVIANWFLALKLNNRRSMANFITRNLVLANGHGNDIEEQALATLDLISRFTYSDLDLVMQRFTKKKPEKGSEVKRWVYGTSVLSLETNFESGYTQLVMRRPTGTTLFNMRPDDRSIPQHLKERAMLLHDKDEDTLSVDNLQLFSASYMMLQTIVPSDPAASLKPVLLYDDEITDRALGAMDRTPVVDFHKVGVLYIGPGQSTEKEILANPTGSRRYRQFLSNLGTLIRLKGNKSVYTGGLDTENDIDGEFAYAWNDKITQMVYHTTTLMPTRDHDPNHSAKKRHVGNNYVSIYFDESGLPFNPDILQSQFNFINIMVSPQTISYKSMHLDGDRETSEEKTKTYYRIRAYRPDNVPAVFAACNLKIVSEEALPLFVRNLALIASKFATVWHSEGQYISNWRYRLQQVRLLEKRTWDKVGEESTRSSDKRTSASNSSGANSASGSGSANGDIDDRLSDTFDDENEQLSVLKNLAFSSFT